MNKHMHWWWFSICLMHKNVTVNTIRVLYSAIYLIKYIHRAQGKLIQKFCSKTLVDQQTWQYIQWILNIACRKSDGCNFKPCKKVNLTCVQREKLILSVYVFVCKSHLSKVYANYWLSRVKKSTIFFTDKQT